MGDLNSTFVWQSTKHFIMNSNYNTKSTNKKKKSPLKMFPDIMQHIIHLLLASVFYKELKHSAFHLYKQQQQKILKRKCSTLTQHDKLFRSAKKQLLHSQSHLLQSD